jgi:hypothetical protein
MKLCVELVDDQNSACYWITSEKWMYTKQFPNLVIKEKISRFQELLVQIHDYETMVI